MSRRRTALVPSLFPFLAVLVCTLGTLILLLALVAKDAEETTQQVAKQARDKKLRDITRVSNQERWRREEMIQVRDRQTATLEERRSELAHLEDHARRIQDDLEAIQGQIDVAINKPIDDEEILQSISSIQDQIELEKEKQRTIEQEKSQKKPRVVIVPHRGPNGTQRRPIYLECRENEIVIQPEGVAISVNQLRGPTGPGNPLDAALRTIRNYRESSDQDPSPPYPLLIVRPSGVIAYSAARISMTAWDDQFGYELVPEDVDLAFPNDNGALKDRLEKAISESLRRREKIVSAVPGRYRKGVHGSDPLGEVLQRAARRRAASLATRSAGHSNSTPMGRWNQSIDNSLTNQDPSNQRAFGNRNANGARGNDSSGATGSQADLRRSGATGAAQSFSGDPAAGDANAEATQTIGNPPGADGGAGSAASQTASGSPSQGASAGESAAQQQRINNTQPPPLANQRGSGWALRGSAGSDDGPAVVRNINMICYANRFEISGNDSENTRVILVDANRAHQSVVSVAKIIRQRVDNWGLALTGGRWQPVLMVAVPPGGEANFALLQSLLHESGIVVKRRGQ